jgi:hypothetical protein
LKPFIFPIHYFGGDSFGTTAAQTISSTRRIPFHHRHDSLQRTVFPESASNHHARDSARAAERL